MDLEYRAFEAGLKFVSTRELTVFKFNSTLRKNCYREKPCHEQAGYTAELERRRWFMLLEAMRIARLHTLIFPREFRRSRLRPLRILPAGTSHSTAKRGGWTRENRIVEKCL